MDFPPLWSGQMVRSRSIPPSRLNIEPENEIHVKASESTRVHRALAVVTLLASACSDPSTAVMSDETQPSLAVNVAATTQVVMSNLNSPRGLAFGPDGSLYVVESGAPIINGACATVARGQNCYSGTGSISRLKKGVQERVVTGLPSIFNPAIPDIAGPQHVGFQGAGNMYITIGWGGAPAARSQLGSLGAGFGSLMRVKPDGRREIVADISAFEDANNPDGRFVDSNPYGLLVEAGRQFVTDAGGNSLFEISPSGNLSLLATFAPVAVPSGPFNPPFALSEAVPTEVRRGPDGALYVSTLTGVPFLPGAATIFRVTPGSAPQAYATGFTQVTALEWGSDGSLYVLQYASAPFFGGPGSLIRLKDNVRTTIISTLTKPTGLAIGKDGAFYVAQNHAVPGGGEVLRIIP